ncbi:MAG TPA: DUF72 domain-containing protein [Polyangiaceae bacterium]|nr:DUF72 domain-containing protein [Polyangiaceae bacterium]
MQIFTGTSGFSYPEWSGHFYPESLPGAQMLRYYATRLETVEINNTFYRMPNRDTVAAWRDEVPDSFCFAIKASRRISHQKKLIDVSEDVAHLFGVVDVLGEKLGPVLFQTPPFLKKDLAVLGDFLACLPQGRKAALEFRHPSWFSDDVYNALSQRNVALVAGDLEEEEKSPPLVATADFGYLRLRRMDYDPQAIADWGARIAAQRWQAAYAYLKHEVLGPLFAEALRATLDGREQADLSAVRASLAAPKPKSTRGAPKSKKGEPKSSKAPASSKKDAAPVSKAPASRGAKTAAARASKAPATAPSKSAPAPSSKAPSKSKKS